MVVQNSQKQRKTSNIWLCEMHIIKHLMLDQEEKKVSETRVYIIAM